MDSNSQWFEQWRLLPVGMRHLLFHLLYVIDSGDDGIECVLTTRALENTPPLTSSRHWELFNVREWKRVSQWVPLPGGLFDNLTGEIDENVHHGTRKNPITWKVATPQGTVDLLVSVSWDDPISAFVHCNERLSREVASEMVETIGRMGMDRMYLNALAAT